MANLTKALNSILNYSKHDIPFDEVCVPCESLNACCEFEGKIIDASDTSRTIHWPYDKDCNPNARKRLLILAKGIREGNTLVGKVNLTRSGDCRDALENRITLKLDDQSGSRFESARSLQGVEVTTEGNGNLWMLAQTAGTASNRAFGWNTPPLLAVFALGQMIADLSRRLSASPALTVTPQMCVNNPPSVTPFDVIAIPEFKVEGGMKWAAMLVLNSERPHITREYEDDPSLTLTYAGEEITWSTTKGSTDSENNDNTPSAGVLGLLDRVVSQLSAFQSEQTQAKEKATSGGQAPLLNNTVGSRVEISAKLDIGANAELKAKEGTPDLLLACSSFSIGLEFGIKGTIDCIQVASTALSPGIARAIREARRRASRENQRFNGYVKADLIFGSQSNIDIKFANTDITLYAEPWEENADRVETNPFDCEGGIRFIAKAELGVHVGAEAWGVKAEAGAFGSLHTAWQVQVRTGASTDPDNPCEYRMFFEGLVAEVNLYARLEGDRNAAGGGDWGSDTSTASSVESNQIQGQKTLFQRVDDHLSEAQTTQAGFDQQSAQANQHSTMNVAEAKRVLRTYDFGGNLTRLGRLEELETSLKNFPDNEENQAALDKLLAEISEEYDERFSPKEELGVYQLLQPTVNPITDESPRWQGFDPFFWRT
ncbi:MAG: hypothetical protein ACK4L8_10985 [Nitrincola lacisaponensis]|uniref:hypothetical protein n=1 Tax=Nitrincola lacisaponensis TaxID=267850 RepID=UPI00391DF87F